MDEPAIWVALAACVTSCFFSACHMALKTFSRTRLSELLGERGRDAQAELFAQRAGDLVLMTGTLRTCLNLLTLLAVLHVVGRWRPQWEPMSHYALSFVFAAALVSVFSVAIPVSWARYRRERLLARSLRPLTLLWWITRPLTALLHLFDPLVRRMSGGDAEPVGSSTAQIADQVLSVVEDHHDTKAVDEDQKEMLEAVFELPTTTAGEIMTPRTEIVALEVGATLEEVKRVIVEHGYSRIPVYRDNIDHIVGLLYAKDLLRFLGHGDGTQGAEPFDLAAVVREPFMVPESKSIQDLLAEFKAKKVHVAIVLDEYGGTAGLVTIEDIIEELVGEIQDEYEPNESEPEIKRCDDGSYDVDARVEIDDFCDELDVRLPEDRDYDTVGGFVFAALGHIPTEGESFEHSDLRVTVTGAERNRVTRVRVERLEPAAPSGERAGDANGHGRSNGH